MKKRGFAAVIGGMLFVFLFVFTEPFMRGLSHGLSLCAETVIPSLFPFLTAASLAGTGTLPPALKKLLDPLTKCLFNLPADSLAAIIIGQFGGYLSGAKAAQALHSSGFLTMNQCGRMMLFCVNAGLGFSVSALGGVMLGSRKAGVIIFASLCLSSALIGILTRFLPEDREQSKKLVRPCASFSQLIVSGVSSSAAAMITVCAFVAMFSGFGAVIEEHIKNENAAIIIMCLLEITSGCTAAAAGKLPLPVIAAFCAFGGICVHLQIFAVADDLKIKIPQFYLFRALHALLCAALCALMLRISPIDEQVFLSVSQKAAAWSFSAPASVSLLFLSALLILDLDNGKKVC